MTFDGTPYKMKDCKVIPSTLSILFFFCCHWFLCLNYMNLDQETTTSQTTQTHSTVRHKMIATERYEQTNGMNEWLNDAEKTMHASIKFKSVDKKIRHYMKTLRLKLRVVTFAGNNSHFKTLFSFSFENRGLVSGNVIRKKPTAVLTIR